MSILNIMKLFETASTMCYIDPAATSVLLSSITAIAIAIGASAIILWRKVKKKVSKTLNIDPNAGKEVEDELVVTDAEVAEEVKAEETATEEVKTEETVAEETPAEAEETETKKEENK